MLDSNGPKMTSLLTRPKTPRNKQMLDSSRPLLGKQIIALYKATPLASFYSRIFYIYAWRDLPLPDFHHNFITTAGIDAKLSMMMPTFCLVFRMFLCGLCLLSLDVFATAAGLCYRVMACRCTSIEEPVFLHRGSVLRKEAPQYVAYQEIYETNKLYMRGQL